MTKNPSSSSSNSHTPLYEKLVSEEAKELKEYVLILKHQSRRLIELDAVHCDLERRLEAEHAERRRLEETLRQREATWHVDRVALRQEADAAERRAEGERAKADKLLEMVHRLQTEIHALIKNRFGQGGNTHLHHHHHAHHPGLNERHPHAHPGTGLTSSQSYSGGNIKRVSSLGNTVNRSSSADANEPQERIGGGHVGPHELLASNGSAEVVRERNALGSILDFFGM